MEEAEKSEKEDVGEAGKAAGKEDEESKDKTEEADRKTESTSQDVNHGEDANTSTNAEDGKENGELVSENLKGSHNGVEADASGDPQKEKEGSEDATSEENPRNQRMRQTNLKKRTRRKS